MPEVNIPLLRKAVEWAEAEAAKPPELCEWYQARVATPSGQLLGRAPQCGTCYCIAGFVAAQVDGRSEIPSYEAVEIAAKSLGLPMSAYDALDDGGLFCGSNTIADVRRIAEELAGERL